VEIKVMFEVLAFGRIGFGELLMILVIAMIVFGLPALFVFSGFRFIVRHAKEKQQLRCEIETLREEVSRLDRMIRSKV